jgi:hypothetical protein
VLVGAWRDAIYRRGTATIDQFGAVGLAAANATNSSHAVILLVLLERIPPRR